MIFPRSRVLGTGHSFSVGLHGEKWFLAQNASYVQQNCMIRSKGRLELSCRNRRRRLCFCRQRRLHSSSSGVVHPARPLGIRDDIFGRPRLCQYSLESAADIDSSCIAFLRRESCCIVFSVTFSPPFRVCGLPSRPDVGCGLA